MNIDQINAQRAIYIPANAIALSIDAPEAIAYRYERNGKLCAVAFHGRARKPDWRFWFPSEARLNARLDTWTKELRDAAQRKTDARAALLAKRAGPIALEVGDVLVSSWGYEQTNVSYYQITRIISLQTVEIREIGREYTRAGGDMSGYVRPKIDSFCSAPMQKRVRGDRSSIRVSSFSIACKLESQIVDGKRVFRENYYSTYA